MSNIQRKRRTLLLLAVLCIVIQSVYLYKSRPFSVAGRFMGSIVAQVPISAQPQADDQNKVVPMISSEIDSPWRYTKQGWQRASNWDAGVQFEPTRTFEQVHPAIWAASVLLAVVATTIWASSEWEIARLFGDEQSE